MGFTASSPSYLCQTSFGYIIRIRIPRDIKPIVGKSEFRYSLRSGALRVAKHRARCIASYIHQLFNQIRSNMAEFTPEKITRLVQGYIRETLENDEKCRSISGPTSDGTTTLPGKTILESSDMKAEEAQSMLHSVNRWLRNQDHSLMKPVTETLIKAEGAEVDPDSDSYMVLGRELLKAFQGILQVRIRRSVGDYSVPDEELIPVLKQGIQAQPIPVPMAAPVVQQETTSLPFTELQERYIAEVEKGENWTEKTKAENLSIFALFVRAMGDMDVSQINRQVMSEYKSLLMQLPPNLNKGSKYQGMELKEIIASKPNETLTVNTINKYMRRLRIPDDSGHPFHLIPATDSIPFRPPIPDESGH